MTETKRGKGKPRIPSEVHTLSAEEWLAKAREPADAFVKSVTETYSNLPDIISALHKYVLRGEHSQSKLQWLLLAPDYCAQLQTLGLAELKPLIDAASGRLALDTCDSLTHAQLAALAGVQRSRITQLIKGKSITAARARKLLDQLGVKVEGLK